MYKLINSSWYIVINIWGKIGGKFSITYRVLCVLSSTNVQCVINNVFNKVVQVVFIDVQKDSFIYHYSTPQINIFKVLINSYAHNPQSLLLKRQIRI